MAPSYSRQNGFTLLEVLIAFMVLSFGLLGAVALQAKAKQASFDSMQRAAAVALANDIMQRIRVNDSAQLASNYKLIFTSQTALNAQRRCFGAQCTSAAIAALDLEQWKLAIRARENTGTLDDTTVCINPKSDASTQGRGFNVEVVVSWRGRQKMKATDEIKAVSCGTNDDQRRLVVLNSFVFARGL
ncbi:type IV pilus modification protein PilV [Pseudoalteromonas sp. MMG005]|uniref:type IV pilus modification protein PilV n=1 Tax=Pseudoalteromonas sp. MMG005 TaxID=2822682 RepID=UPI001B3A6E47|nr:type IV pilus modification protein PilV [Pseudoalteromonas sp. MMG005]MBQ4845809.1 type IV pilus modification protein PilV [Pseudoalteromonas sp. MMG005]